MDGICRGEEFSLLQLRIFSNLYWQIQNEMILKITSSYPSTAVTVFAGSLFAISQDFEAKSWFFSLSYSPHHKYWWRSRVWTDISVQG